MNFMKLQYLIVSVMKHSKAVLKWMVATKVDWLDSSTLANYLLPVLCWKKVGYTFLVVEFQAEAKKVFEIQLNLNYV